MTFKPLLAAILAATILPVTSLTAVADDLAIVIEDPYARTSRPNAPTGAAFMVVVNHGDTEDRLIGAASEIAARVELHTHLEDANGVMRMIEVEDGIPVPAGGRAELKRGGDHVMFMGLTGPLANGDTVEVTLTFEEAGEITVQIPVDLDRKPDQRGMDHGTATN